jgi:hypothetical protein
MANLTFWDYTTAGGRNVIQEWFEEIPEGAKKRLNALIRGLIANPLLLRHPYAHKLKDSDGIWELRASYGKSGEVQYRPLGYVEDGKFIIVVGAIEKNDKLIPATAIKTAQERRRAVQTGAASINEHDDA